MEKKEFINGEMTNRLHDAVVDVALKRKECPSKYATCLSQLTLAEQCRLGQLKVICKRNTAPVSPPDNVLSSNELLDRLKDTECTLASILQSSNREVTKAENLKTVEKIYLKNKNSTKMNVLLTAPLKSTEKRTVSTKKLRFSPRLHSIRKPRTRLKLS